ncbi:MAG: hypothetical protein BGN99_08455 [Alphaproteobacteria bacterium 65-37]|nr:MAG: hypothetical protein BGN99_08455 [Alphaproteobacteria bacterium 65-37]
MLHAVKVIPSKETSTNPTLVGDDDNADAEFICASDCHRCRIYNPNIFATCQVTYLFDDHTISVQK